jgi:hypothetical protein
MPRIKYKDKKIGAERLAIIATANGILSEYRQQGFQLTLRQLYYKFVARDIIPNTMKQYKLLGSIINDGRLCGLIDWNDITDMTRNIQSVSHWTDPAHIVGAVADQFRIDKWATQGVRPEVWIEKDAMASIVEGICTELDIAYFSCRGYTSQSEMWAGAMRLMKYKRAGQKPLILHFGDHDPSGIDMTRDITDRMSLFMGGATIERLALNWDQIEEYQPPPNPAKEGDSRSASYIAEFGDSSWELDALEPAVVVDLIRSTVEGVRDNDAWQQAVDEENEHRRLLKKASTEWDNVVEFLSTMDDES